VYWSRWLSGKGTVLAIEYSVQISHPNCLKRDIRSLTPSQGYIACILNHHKYCCNYTMMGRCCVQWQMTCRGTSKWQLFGRLATPPWRGLTRTCASRPFIHSSTEVSDVDEKRMGKRKVALFVGYDGTHYRGLQMQPSQTGVVPGARTVEDVLEDAIFKSGGILESNRGSLTKIKWSRSSRTDKRVHSLSTVISLKLECEADIFLSEPDGSSIVNEINKHLPEEVQVFAVQRVVKSFDARRECIRRYYEYYLPVSFLKSMMEKRNQNDDIEDILRRLGGAWAAYEGHHAFHNFTKRRLYRTTPSQRDRKAATGGTLDGPQDDQLTNLTETRNFYDDDSPSEIYDEEKERNAEEEEGPRRHVMRFAWKAERDEYDPIVRSHYRYVEECSFMENPITLVDHGGEPCVKLSVFGASFMLHQIRHMVGGAVLVALGMMQLDLLRAALAPPVRMNLPLAPPGTLVLRGADFGKFRKSYDGKPSVTERASGSSLMLLGGGVERQEAFEKSILYRGLNNQLKHEDWAYWSESLSKIDINPVEAADIIEKSKEWVARRNALKEERRSRRETEARD
jgi:tRNA pseudouridine38-40 synthase